MIFFDLWLIYASIALSIIVRVGHLHEETFRTTNALWLVPILGIVVFLFFGLYSIVVRFVDSGYSIRVLKASFALMLVLQSTVFFVKPDFFPRSSAVIFFLICTGFLIGSRSLARWFFSQATSRRHHRKNVLIYGAGSAGLQISQGLKNSLEYRVIAFIDDKKSLRGQYISDLKVYGSDRIQQLVLEYSIAEIILAIPSLSRKRRQEILDGLKDSGASLKLLPGINDLVGGKVQITDLREVSVIDILGRDEVPPDQKLLDQCILGQVVFVTGAGGSIGSELCRQIGKVGPSKLVLFDHSEFNLYAITQELSAKGYNFGIVPVLGDIRNQELISEIIKEHGVDTIYHAAAYKHVPLFEENFKEGLNNNVFGTEAVALAALDHKVRRFILISTDKAVRPTNIMGASKRISELILQSLSQGNSQTIFSMVRFGNVLASSGSVVPLFQSQIKMGGPVTVTHPDVTRYFMTIPEAAQLVIQAGSMAMGGEVFVLDMGSPIKIVDLARRMIELSGYTVRDEENPEGDIEIYFTGLRPGEKLYEELLIGEKSSDTGHPRIMKASESSLSPGELEQLLTDLKKHLKESQISKVKEFLRAKGLNYLG